MDAPKMKRITWKVFKDLEETQEPIHWIHHLSENQRGLIHPSVFENLPW